MTERQWGAFEEELARRLQEPTLRERISDCIGRIAGPFIMPNVVSNPDEPSVIRAGIGGALSRLRNRE